MHCLICHFDSNLSLKIKKNGSSDSNVFFFFESPICWGYTDRFFSNNLPQLCETENFSACVLFSLPFFKGRKGVGRRYLWRWNQLCAMLYFSDSRLRLYIWATEKSKLNPEEPKKISYTFKIKSKNKARHLPLEK